MKCQRCNNHEATAFIKKNINGNITELALCSSCAKNSGEFDMNFGFSDLFSNLFSDFIYSNAGFIGEKVTCPVCKSSFDDIARSGRVGCAKCYEIFNEQLIPTIRNYQRKTIHSGKRPSGKAVMPKSDNKNELQNLESELEKAIQVQNFEYAAELRDKINTLKESEGK